MGNLQIKKAIRNQNKGMISFLKCQSLFYKNTSRSSLKSIFWPILVFLKNFVDYFF